MSRLTHALIITTIYPRADKTRRLYVEILETIHISLRKRL